MSELNDSFPSNSHKSQEQAQEQKQGDQKPVIPIFEGESAGAVRKKSTGKSFLRWCRKMFLSDRKPKDIAKDVIENQFVPGVIDTVRNALVSSLDMAFYKNSSPSSNSSNNISYSKMYRSSNTNIVTTRTRSSNGTSEKDNQKDEDDLSNGFNNPCFRTQADAINFLKMMKEYDYPTLSVHTLYMMRKKHIDYTWDAYGWTKEEIAAVNVVHINNPQFPWMINLPEAHVIS